ncbi:orotidine 5'-phosphate decarboxylase [Clostridia bacterium]|nr:orotidine 5'-phosphate decarboxylase [Clostridia bacterium]
MDNITDVLIDKIKEKSNPAVVGLDPQLSFIPDCVKESSYKQFGKTAKGASEAIFEFNKYVIDVIAPYVPAVKPQIAMYEQFGAHGIDAFVRTVQFAKERGLVVIGDVKRGDIASTAKCYSDGHIGRVDIDGESVSVYDEDFITINPYLGYDSVEPYLSNLEKYGKGLFVLVKTSNPNSGEIQDLYTSGIAVHEKVGELVANWGKTSIGRYGYSAIGAVVGATHRTQAENLRALMPSTFFLVPGYGAQGATAEDIAVCFKNGIGAIVNSSRGIIAAHTSRKYARFAGEFFTRSVLQAVIDMREDLRGIVWN